MTEYISDDELQRLVRRLGAEPGAEPDVGATTGREGASGEGGAANGTSDSGGISNEFAAPDSFQRAFGGSRLKTEDGMIVVRYGADYETGDLAVEAASPVRLFVNGERAEGRTKLRRGDRIDWEAPAEPLFDIRVTPDAMKAYLAVRRTERFAWTLNPAEATDLLIVEVTEDRGRVEETLTIADVVAAAHRMGIDERLDLTAVVEEIAAPTFAPVLIATGTEPIPSRDARLDVYFAETIESVFEEFDGTVDFRNHLRIPQANAGDVIAKKTEPSHGASGRNVYNHMVVPDPPVDIAVRAGRHVRITPEGDVVALKAGRPKLSGGGNVRRFDIATEFVVRGDVGIESGNIVFSGDVVVYGDVLDGMIVESLGNVYVFGNVYRSTISATGSVFISGNAMSSQLYSGYFGVVFNRMYSLLKRLIPLTEQLLEAAETLSRIVRDQGKSATIGQIALTLVQTKFPLVPRMVRELTSTWSNVRNAQDAEWRVLQETADRLARPWDFLRLESLEPLRDFLEACRSSSAWIEEMQEARVSIQFGQSHGSVVKSNGDIYVSKEGTFQSKLFARGSIVYRFPAGVCRGGEIEAGGPVDLQTVGGPSGGEAIVRTLKTVTARHVYTAKICIGRYEEYIQRPLRNVNARLDRGRMVISGEQL